MHKHKNSNKCTFFYFRIIVLFSHSQLYRCSFYDANKAHKNEELSLLLFVYNFEYYTRLDVRCTPDIYCSLSGAPEWARLTSARAERALNVLQVAVGAD
jgi:hypothetical protein